MKTMVQVSDEVIGGSTNTWQLDLAEERMTVRELIRSRVYQEVQDVNLRRRNQHQMLHQFAEASKPAQGTDSIGRIDWKVHFEQALAAFEAGRFLLLVGDYQSESLDEVVELKQDTKVTFLKLIPLVGG